MRHIRKKRNKYIIRFLTIFCYVLLAGLVMGGISVYLMYKMPFFSMDGDKPDNIQKLQWEPIVTEENEEADTASNRQDQAALPEETEKPEEESGQPVEEQQEGIYYKETRVQGETTLVFAGDILFDDSYSPMYALKRRENGVADTFSGDLLREMTEADIFMLNNEFTFTSRGEPLPDKSYTFRSNPENVKYLFDMGVDLVSLANNHSFDFGEVSLLDTLDTLEAAGMPQVGAGRNFEEASAPVYFDTGEMRIGFLAATQIERIPSPPTRGATENMSGVFRCLEPAALYTAVTEAKKNCDYLVVFIHWGTEKTDQPDWAQLEQGPGLAEAGADLIIGAHPHVLQGLESVDGVPVVYSLGNFWFNSYTLDTCIVKVVFDTEGLKSFQFLPALQQECRTSLMTGEEKKRVLDYIRTLSPNVLIDEEGYVTF